MRFRFGWFRVGHRGSVSARKAPPVRAGRVANLGARASNDYDPRILNHHCAPKVTSRNKTIGTGGHLELLFRAVDYSDRLRGAGSSRGMEPKLQTSPGRGQLRRRHGRSNDSIPDVRTLRRGCTSNCRLVLVYRLDRPTRRCRPARLGATARRGRGDLDPSRATAQLRGLAPKRAPATVENFCSRR
jgi:hypothetical protein